jgi:hypothetical protein
VQHPVVVPCDDCRFVRMEECFVTPFVVDPLARVHSVVVLLTWDRDKVHFVEAWVVVAVDLFGQLGRRARCPRLQLVLQLVRPNRLVRLDNRLKVCLPVEYL